MDGKWLLAAEATLSARTRRTGPVKLVPNKTLLVRIGGHVVRMIGRKTGKEAVGSGERLPWLGLETGNHGGSQAIFTLGGDENAITVPVIQ